MVNMMFPTSKPTMQGVGSVKTKLIERSRAMEIASSEWKHEE
jgi:hypothetical protein